MLGRGIRAIVSSFELRFNTFYEILLSDIVDLSFHV